MVYDNRRGTTKQCTTCLSNTVRHSPKLILRGGVACLEYYLKCNTCDRFTRVLVENLSDKYAQYLKCAKYLNEKPLKVTEVDDRILYNTLIKAKVNLHCGRYVQYTFPQISDKLI